MLGDLPIEGAAFHQVGCLELVIRLEREPRLLDEAEETRVLLVTERVKGCSEKVLFEVVRELFLVRVVVVAGVELLGEEEQTADAIAMPGKVSFVRELVSVLVSVASMLRSISVTLVPPRSQNWDEHG